MCPVKKYDNIMMQRYFILSQEEVAKMKKWTALLLAMIMCLSLCACGSTDDPEPSSSPEEELTQNVRLFINTKCTYTLKDVKSTQATVHVDDVDTSSNAFPNKAIYSVSGEIRITDAFGDQYTSQYTGEWTYEQDGTFSERSFHMDTPVKAG